VRSLPFDTSIHDLSTAGDGIGRHPDGRVVFVAQALPGDVVQAEITHTRRGVHHAELQVLKQASLQRVPSRCSMLECGGCAVKGASMALQRTQKIRSVSEAMRRLGKISLDPASLFFHDSAESWGYRHRIRLHADHLLGGWRLGYYARHSRRLVPLAMCPVAWPELEQLALDLARLLAPLPAAAGLTEIDLAYSRCDGRGAARVVADGPLELLRRDLSWFERSGLGGVELQAADGRLRLGNLLLRYDHARLDHFDLRYEPGMFTQASPGVNDALVDAVLAATAPQAGPRVLELHAGIGNFSVPLARAGADVEAVEVHRASALMCQRNARAPGLAMRSRAVTDVEAIRHAEPYDVLLADPPRRGMLPVVQQLVRQPSKPARVIYVSCDPATLARDAKVLCGTAEGAAAGPYVLRTCSLFDMFAQTPHVETLAVFDRI
jgi:23S rRNA (uracil1939-C5)-methyltransferase